MTVRFASVLSASGGRTVAVYPPRRHTVDPSVAGVTAVSTAPGVQAGSGSSSPLRACR